MKKTQLDETLIALASGKPVNVHDITSIVMDINAFGDTVPRTFLMAAAYAGRNDLLSDLVQGGANVDLLNENGMGAIHEAAMLGHATTVEKLHELGADIETAGRHGWTPLMFASSAGEKEVVQLLLNLGADVYRRNESGMTALDIADQKDREAVAAVLAEAYKSK